MEKVISEEFTGKTSEEAIELGLKEMNLTREEAEIEIIEEAKKRLFSSTKARVRITAKIKEEEAEVKANEPVKEEITVEVSADAEERVETEELKRTTDFLNGLFEILQMDAKIIDSKDGEKMEINLETGNSNSLIGRRGEILDAIQTLAGAVANIGRDDYKRVVVDCLNYREKREETLERLAKKLAEKAVNFGKKVSLEPMNPYERRIIHAALSDNTDVKTQSEGKEPNRYVVIIPNNLKPYSRDSRPYNKDRKPFNRDRKPFDGERKPYDPTKKPYNRDRKPYDGERKPYDPTRKPYDGERKPYDPTRKPYDGERKPYDPNRKPYNRDRKPYDGERKPYDPNRRPFNKDYVSAGSGSGTGSYVKQDRPAFKKSSSGFFGTYLGNSKTDSENKTTETDDTKKE